jgi:carboxypeptidase C (cathepsin A)
MIILGFSAWETLPHYLTLRQQAGEAAFHQTVATKQLHVNGSIINYRATTGYLTVSDGDEHTAQMFYTAYTSGPANRPVTFVFNGGPGSSSIWLHMGSFGPVRAVTGKAGYKDNADTWLGFTDLVFIDPVGTGYSRPDDGTDARRFYGYQEDITSVGHFIQHYLTENNRGQSPLFLAGESYGAARAVGLASHLKDDLKINVAGLILISPALDYRLVSFRKGNDKPYPYYLTAYAAAAQFHSRLSPALQALSAQQLAQKVNKFAFVTYQPALSTHKALSADIIDTLSRYTGIDSAVIRQLNGRITDKQFAHLLLSSTEEIAGTYDSRDAGSISNSDPGERKLHEVFPQALATFNKDVLRYRNKLPYLATIATPTWDNGSAVTNGYLNVTPLLKRMLAADPNLKVQIVSGSFDLATPPATINRLVADLGDESGKVNVNRYDAGHMIYTDGAANNQWRKDSEKFYSKTMLN